MRRFAGFSLIEALVALLVISFGLLGVATMQLKALEGAHVGYRHSLVNLMAIDAQERVWKSLAENSGDCPVDSTLTAINDAWIGYWFDTAKLGFTDHASAITWQGVLGGKCEYSVLVSWEALPYSIYEENNKDEGNGGGGNKATTQEPVRQFEYIFRVPQ